MASTDAPGVVTEKHWLRAIGLKTQPCTIGPGTTSAELEAGLQVVAEAEHAIDAPLGEMRATRVVS
jgi:hypothetical protein